MLRNTLNDSEWAAKLRLLEVIGKANDRSTPKEVVSMEITDLAEKDFLNKWGREFEKYLTDSSKPIQIRWDGQKITAKRCSRLKSA